MDARQLDRLDRIALLSAHIKMLGEITFALVGRSSEDWGPEAMVRKIRQNLEYERYALLETIAATIH
jgi:hypothetical protein